MADDGKAPIIIKKIKKGGHGHHGGAWKVAYADFVTAMMAFFLLLWLLSTTTPEQRDGIAEYFTPTVGLKDAKGIGFEGGLTPNDPGASRTAMGNPGLVSGQTKQGPTPDDPKPQQDITTESEDTGQQASGMPEANANQMPPEAKERPEQEQEDQAVFKKMEQDIQQQFEQSPELQQYKKNLIISNTPEGLRIDVVDDPEKPAFVPGTATMTDVGRAMFKAISGVITKSQHQIAVAGHTEHVTYPPGATYTSWELSADRANATRRYLMENLIGTERIAKVQGLADRDLLLPKEPLAPRNRRIGVTLLRGTTVGNTSAPVDQGLITQPKVDANKLAAPAPVEAPAEEKPVDPGIFTPH